MLQEVHRLLRQPDLHLGLLTCVLELVCMVLHEVGDPCRST